MFSSTTAGLWPFIQALISTRIINGLLSGRLSTGLHLGTINPQFSGNTRSFYKLLHGIIVLTLVTSLTVSVISLFFGYLFLGIRLIDFPALLSVMVCNFGDRFAFFLCDNQSCLCLFQKRIRPRHHRLPRYRNFSQHLHHNLLCWSAKVIDFHAWRIINHSHRFSPCLPRFVSILKR